MTPIASHPELAVPAPPPGFRGVEPGLEKIDALPPIPSTWPGDDDLHDDRLHLDLPE